MITMPMSIVKIRDDEGGTNEHSTGPGISAFLGKLWKMVADPKTDHLISWGQAGTTFVIKNQIGFAKTILPNYYKHNNIASFIRQLNMYGFHKIISTTSGSLDSVDNDEIEFSHPNFVRGRSYLLEQIKRKMNNPKENIVKPESSPEFTESIRRILTDVKQLKGKQEYLNSQLCSVKQENEILWRELSLLRQKHAAQQNILNKLIRFLVSLAQPTNHTLMKRKLGPLMLKDSSTSNPDIKREPLIEEDDHVYTRKKHSDVSSGPTIHEIRTSDILDDMKIDEAPVIEVGDVSDIQLEYDQDIGETTFECSVTSPEPVPTALLCSNRNGKRRIQKVYFTSDHQEIPSHFLFSPSNIQSEEPEYLIPDRTDNAYMELVTEPGMDNIGYITVIDDNGTEIPATLIAECITKSAKPGRGKTSRRKAQLASGRKMPKKNTTNSTLVKRVVQRPKRNENQTLLTSSFTLQEIESPKAINTDDFLIDIGLQNEPSIEIHTTNVNNDSSPVIETQESVSQIKIEIPMGVEEVIATSPCVESTNSLNVPPNPNNVPSPIKLTLNDTPSLNPCNVVLPPNSTNINASLNLDAPLSKYGQKMIEGENRKDEALMKQMNDCIDNAQNMIIACTDNNGAPPSKAYVDDISSQLDTMQSDIKSLKELMHNEGLTLNVNTILGLFSEDPMDYIMSTGNSGDFPKMADDKILGNELISAPSMFDFNDIFQDEWSKPNTPMSTLDSDYCSLNTPLIERNSDEYQVPSLQPLDRKIRSK